MVFNITETFASRDNNFSRWTVGTGPSIVIVIPLVLPLQIDPKWDQVDDLAIRKKKQLNIQNKNKNPRRKSNPPVNQREPGPEKIKKAVGNRFLRIDFCSKLIC